MCNLLVSTISVGEQLWVPVHVNNIIKMTKAIIIYPEDTIIKHLCTFWIIVEELAHFWSPVRLVHLRVIAFPTEM